MTLEEKRKRNAAYERAARAANPEKYRARERAWYAAHKEQQNARDRARHAANPEANRARVKAWVAANPERAKATMRICQRRRKYGLQPGEFEAMLAAQGHACKLCRTALQSVSNRTHVDHCHATGRVRGVLCIRCNTRLGQIERRGPEGVALDLAYLGWSL